MEKIKPCPFCGNEAHLYHHSDISSYVKCDKCGATKPEIIISFSYSSDELAIISWNERPDEN